MKTHLIDDLDDFGIWNDNYEQFIQKRAKSVSYEISRKLIHQEIDRQGQSYLNNDCEEEITIAG